MLISDALLYNIKHLYLSVSLHKFEKSFAWDNGRHSIVIELKSAENLGKILIKI